ncbi:MAG: high-potential iron-sulfur protein [Burkholderiaceae bacterium]|nr:high-potential iron-sulfur protein [Burkholderiaceae bacterium]
MTFSIQDQPTGRRTFIIQSVCATAALAAGSAAQAQALLAETDAQATALGYKADATKVDKAKQPKYAAGQICGNCALFQGKPSDAAGGCPLFAGKQVATKGWCSAWAKKG